MSTNNLLFVIIGALFGLLGTCGVISILQEYFRKRKQNKRLNKLRGKL